jgi:hypothetical protein
MHPQALKSMENHINIALQACSVENGWPISNSFTNEISSLSKEIIKQKKGWLTNLNCYLIFFDHVHSYLKRKFPATESVSGKLKELIDEKEMLELKTSILDFIRSIPRSYEIYFHLPSFKDPEINNIQLSDSLFIKKFTEDDSLLGPSADKVISNLKSFKRSDSGNTYIIIQAQGYTRFSIDDIAFRESLSNLKQILHMCLILDLIKPAVSVSSFLGGSLFNPTIEAKIIDLANQNEIYSRISLPSSISSHIQGIIPNTSSKMFTEARQYGEEGIRTLFTGILKETCYLMKRNDSNAQFVKSAIEWAFDSQIEENETISFIQVSIGLEAILGEETGRESLTETLADRCAYLLANTVENRKIIRDYFRDFYKLRSKLIHGRSMRLKDDEKWFLDWGKKILNNTILKEIKNLNLIEA